MMKHLHRDLCIHIEMKYRHGITTQWVYKMVLIKIFFAVHLKHSSFEPLDDVKPMPNDLLHSMHACSLSLSVEQCL